MHSVNGTAKPPTAPAESFCSPALNSRRSLRLVPIAKAILLALPLYFAVVLPEGIAAAIIGWSILMMVYLAVSETLEGKPALALATLLVLLLMQNLLIGFSLNFVERPSRTVLLLAIEAKTIYALTAFGALVLVRRKKRIDRRLRSRLLVAFCLIVLACLTAMVSERGEAFTVAAYIRNFLTPLLYVSIGLLLAGLSGKAIEDWVSLIAAFVVVATPFTLAQLGFPSQWENLLNIGTIEAVKGPISSLGGLPGLFSVPRSAGMVGEGVNAAYAFGTFTLILFSQRRYITAALSFFLCLLAFGKGGMLLLVAAAGLYFLVKRIAGTGLKVSARLVVGLAIVGTAIVFLAYVVPDRDPFDRGAFNTASSAEVHILGLKYGLDGLRYQLLGHGVGIGGNFSDIASGSTLSPETWIRSGSESAVGVVSFQLGVLGLSSMLLFFFFAARGIKEREAAAEASLEKNYCIAAGALLVALFGLLFIQENVLSPQAVGAAFISVGIALARQSRHRGNARG